MNLHFHSIFLDGCYARDRLGTPRFRPVTPHTSDVEKLVVEIAIACEDWLSKAGFGADDDVSDPDDDGLGLFQAAAAAGGPSHGTRRCAGFRLRWRDGYR